MAKARTPETLKIDEREDGVHVILGDFGGTEVGTLWTRTLETLHTLLVHNGWHRTKKQEDSQVGGEYTR